MKRILQLYRNYRDRRLRRKLVATFAKSVKVKSEGDFLLLLNVSRQFVKYGVPKSLLNHYRNSYGYHQEALSLPQEEELE